MRRRTDRHADAFARARTGKPLAAHEGRDDGDKPLSRPHAAQPQSSACNGNTVDGASVADRHATTAPAALVAKLREYDPRQALVIAREEDLIALSPLVRIDVTAVALGECASVGGGRFMPARDATDRIAQAAGITFEESGCSVEKIDRCVWVGRVTASRMARDGSTTRMVAEYEWDAELRAEEQARATSGAKYDGALLQARKFGRQRADTGARLRVIRMLAGIPTAFAKADIAKPLVLHRCSRDTEAMMADPALREMLVKQMLGATGDVFGPPGGGMRNVTPAPEALPEPEDVPEAPEEPAQPEQHDGMAALNDKQVVAAIKQFADQFDDTKRAEARKMFAEARGERQALEIVLETVRKWVHDPEPDPGATLDDTDAQADEGWNLEGGS